MVSKRVKSDDNAVSLYLSYLYVAIEYLTMLRSTCIITLLVKQKVPAKNSRTSQERKL
jgi:hypothetical protein